MQKLEHKWLVTMAIVLVALLCPQWTRAQFSGSGSGTENDPYLIFNPIQLNEVRNYLNNSNVWFKMMYDIDLEEWLADNNPTQGWQPIGNLSSKFKGHFLGMGHKISGFFINRSSTDYVGFFGYTDGATISDLIIEGELVKGNSYVAGLAGFASGSTISNCRAVIDVSGSNQKIGGLLGCESGGSCSSSSFSGNVTGSSYVGGFAGETANATLNNCSVSATVTATSNYSSLFIGYGNGTTISSLKGDGQVAGKTYVGGVMGYNITNASTITGSSVEGKVSGTSNVAGFVGYSGSSLSISASNFVGEVTGASDNVGGIVGYSYNANLNINDSYAIADVTGKAGTGGLIGNKNGGCDYVNINSIFPSPYTTTSTTAYSIGSTSLVEGYTVVYYTSSGGTNNKYTYTLYPTTNVRFSASTSNYSVGNTTAWPGYLILFKNRGGSGQYYYYYLVVPTSEVDNFVKNATDNRNNIVNNYFNGTVSGTSQIGGLIGVTNANAIRYNYCYGSITGTDYVGGLLGQLSDENVSIKIEIDNNYYDYSTPNHSFLESNVAVVETVNATQSNVGRIYGSTGNYVTIGTNGTATENKGLATSKVTLNGLQQELPDNQQHGTNVGNATLKLRATYQGIGWDFSKWQILETESYPYKQGQCAPPVIGDLISGSTVVSGKSANGGTVYLTIGDKQYSAETNANVWSITVDPLQAGDLVKAYAISDELEHSYYTKQTVRFKGKGTKAEPYEIYTANDLSNINSYSYYKLMNDIDLTEWIQANNPTKGWIPIGLSGGGSMRQLDGDGYKITGLWSNTTTDFYGLIANTQEATICNLNVFTANGKALKGGNNTGAVVGKAVNTLFSNVTVNGNVQGTDYVGGIAGYCANNTYENCRMTGSVTGHNYVGGISSGYGNGSTMEDVVFEGTVTGNDYVGGLAAKSTGSITASHTEATVTGNNYVGGLVGQSASAISECYSTGSVSATNNTACYAGGITGVNNGSITDCYSSADVSSGVVDGSVVNNQLQQYAGGIAGYSYGSITRCFASGNLFAVKFGAGIVGYNDGANATTSNCFAINDRIDVSNETGIALRVIGGIKNNAPTPEANNYALKTMVVSVNNVTQTIYDDLLHGASRTLNVLKQGATYTANGWDLENVWDIDEGMGFPFLRASAATNTPIATALNIEEEVTIFKGDSYPIEVSILPNTASTNLRWTSSDPTIVSVNDQGVVFGLQAGRETITAATLDGSGLTATCIVTVKEHAVPATGITLNREAVTMTIGQTVPLQATITPENADNQNVVWNSIDATVATVNSYGVVTAMKAGTTQIVATTADGTNLSATCDVTVIDAAGNYLDADPINAHNADEFEFAVRLNNEETITALQCDIYLPEGITIATEEGDYLIDLVTARMGTNHVVSTNVLPNGSIRMFITSATSKPFKGNEGDLFILNLIVDKNAVGGNYSLDFRNVILSDVNAQTYYAPDLNVPVTIKDFIKGDVNIDGTVNVSDYVATANYILELNPQPFIFAAADIDENLTINVSDLVGVANIALNFLGAPVINYAPAQDYDGLGRMALAANCSNIAPGRYVVTLDLNNSSAITAFQMDINLPMGMKLVNANLSNRASSSHTLEMAELANGTYRLLGSSMMSKAFAGNEGSLLTLEIEGAATGNAVIDGIMLAEPNTFLHKHDAMMLTFDASGVSEMCSDVRIYTENGMVVVESPVANKVQFILPNGMSVERDVKAGRNVYNTGLNGVVIVKVSNQVKKFKL